MKNNKEYLINLIIYEDYDGLVTFCNRICKKGDFHAISREIEEIAQHMAQQNKSENALKMRELIEYCFNYKILIKHGYAGKFVLPFTN